MRRRIGQFAVTASSCSGVENATASCGNSPVADSKPALPSLIILYVLPESTDSSTGLSCLISAVRKPASTDSEFAETSVWGSILFPAAAVMGVTLFVVMAVEPIHPSCAVRKQYQTACQNSPVLITRPCGTRSDSSASL